MAGPVIGFLTKTFIGKMIASYAISAVTNKLFGPKAKTTSPTYSFGTLQTQTNSSMPMALIYGKVKGAGNVIWSDTGSTVRNRLVSFGVGKNKSFSDVRINDNVISSLPGCNYTAYLGDGEQLIDSRVTGATQEDKAKLVGGLKYDSYLAITATASDKLSSDGYTVTAIVEGRIVRIYTSLTEYYEDWTDNPAWCFLDFMTSVDGCGLDVSANYIPSFLSLASYADGLVKGKKRFTFNMTMDERKSRQDWLDEILATCRGYRTYQNGLHGILVDKPELVSQVFNVKPDESIETWWQDNVEDVERLQIEYVDPDYEYTKVVAQADRVQLAGEVTQFRNKIPLTKKISVYGINNFEQASREAWFHLNKAQTCPEWIQYTTNKRALNRSIGDVVGITNPITDVTEEGLTYKRYRIMTMSEPQENKITMSMQEYNPNLYTDQQASVAPTINVTILDNPATPPPDVHNMQVNQVYYRQADGSIMSYITGSCTLPDYGNFSEARLECSIDNGATWSSSGKVNTDGTFEVYNVKTGISYIIRIKVVNRMGISSDGVISEAIYITGKDNPPPDIETLLVEKMATGSYRFSFEVSSSLPDLAGYRFKYNMGKDTWWDSAISLCSGLINSSPFVSDLVPSGIVTVMVKAVDNSGNESENVAYAVFGLGDTIVNNVLDENDFGDFLGEKINCTIDANGYLIANDTGGYMYAADNLPIYSNNNNLFYRTTWSEMTYIDTFSPQKNGYLSFDSNITGNAQIYYRRQYPYSMYGAGYNSFYGNDDDLMYKEGPWAIYGGKVETVADIHQVKVEIATGTTQGIIKELKAIIDVEDIAENINDYEIASTGSRLPIANTYIAIKNIGITLQEVNGSTALTARVVDKNPTGPLIMLYDKNNNAVSGVVDATIQGY